MSVYSSLLDGVAAPRRHAVRARGRTGDRLAIGRQPFTHLVEPPGDRLGDHPLGGRPDIQEEVAAFGGDVDQRADERPRVFPVVVIRLESPGVVHRHAGFPVDAREPLRRHLLLGCSEVAEIDPALLIEPAQALARVAHAVVHEQGGADPAHVVVEISPPLVRPICDPLPVEPEHVDLGVLGEQLLELGLHVGLDVATEVGIGVRPRVVIGEVRALRVGVMPVHDRVVDAEPEPGAVRRLCQGLERVPVVRRGVDDVVARHLRIEDREAVVVLGRDDDVLHPRVLGDVGPRVGVEPCGVEAVDIRLVFGDRDVRPAHDPLADAADPLSIVRAGRHRIRAPMNEHSEPCLAPPGHAGVALGGRLRGLDLHDCCEDD